ncbi:MAG: hypothetical protein JWQ96_450 [Segetibacter sp.]|nr:hypothetical protein [Segetibacter sp.]
MIPVNELRKGSWVKHNGANVYVTQIMWNRLEVALNVTGDKQYQECKYDNLQPIILTPEVMKDCGFIKHELFPHRNVFYHKHFFFTINIIGTSYEVSYGLIAESIAMIYQKNLFLHQLQNLYFSLTGEELGVSFS